MKDNRRDFIIKGTALAAMSAIGMNAVKPGLFSGGSESGKGIKMQSVPESKKPVLKVALQP